MKITILLAFLVMLVVACNSTSNPNSGAPETPYEVLNGQGNEPEVNTNEPPTNFPQGAYYRWRYQGITPTTP